MSPIHHRLSRRHLVRAAAFATLAAGGGLWSCAARAEAAGVAAAGKRVRFTHLHTGEHLDVEFYRDGAFVPAALAQIEVLLRDFRSGERHPIDPLLIARIHSVALAAGTEAAFSVISGYRSPRTNEQLRARSSGVAEHSLHLEGRAIDVRLAGVDCRTLAEAAEKMGGGGVGYYRASDFVHLDTGRPRSWRG